MPGPIGKARASPTCRSSPPTRRPCRSTPRKASARSTSTSIASPLRLDPPARGPNSRAREEHKMAQHVWEKSYPPGVTWELEIPRKSIHQIFEESCAQFGDRPFTDFLDRVMTFRDYKEASDKAAAGFQKLGVKPGVNVGLYLPNTPHYLIAFFGVLKAGGKVVNY